jgi:sulfhydrogenase subunit alpha
MSKLLLVEDLARVEGHGGITVELEGNQVVDVQFNVFEGPRVLEQLLHGRRYDEVAGIISRICAICSAAHCVSSLQATEAAFGLEVSGQTKLLRELLFRGENIESHALHIFLLSAPDYLGFPSATALARTHPAAVKLGLALKQLGNTMQEVIGGRAIHPVNPVLGGFGRVPAMAQLVDLRNQIAQALTQVPLALDIVAGLPRTRFCDAQTTFAATAARGEYGYYETGELLVRSAQGLRAFGKADYRQLTNERVVAHSYARHSHLDDAPFMVGALARLIIRADDVPPAGRRALKHLELELPTTNPLDNIYAQAVELALDLEYSLESLDRLLGTGVQPEKPAPVTPRAGSGTAITEAPRGILVHSYQYNEAGRIVDADVITPTAMNAASIEQHFRAVAAQNGSEDLQVLKRQLELTVRAYDPCISCSVHVVRRA